ncbi:hypothetical protein J0H58_28880 [bacterium]|nr:hypothetical protein [bacterium]
MEAFSSKGTWWLADRPDDTFAGTLNIGEDGEVRLELQGAPVPFQNFLKRDDPPVPFILGELRERHKFFGRAATLVRCWTTRMDGGFGGTGTLQEFRAERAYIGQAHLSAAAPEFRQTRLRFSGLNAWADTYTGFRSIENSFGRVWDAPELIRGPVPGAELSIGAGCDMTGGRHEVRLAEYVELTLTFPSPIGEAELDARFIYPLQNLFTLITDAPNTLTRLVVWLPGSETASYSVFAAQTYSDETEAVDQHPYKMLLPYSLIEGDAPRIFGAWLDLYARRAFPLAMYFAGRYDSPRYVDLRLQLLLQALASYTGVTATRPPPDPSVPWGFTESFPPEYRGPKTSFEMATTHPILEASFALIPLREAYTLLFGERTEDRWNRFRADVLNTLTYILLRDPAQADPPEGGTYYELAETVDLLFKVTILLSIGLDPALVEKQLRGNPQARLVKQWQSAGG